MQQLDANPDKAMAQMARYSIYQVEQKYEAHREVLDQLDSLKRSESFYLNEYNGDDVFMHLSNVRTLISQQESLLACTTAPRTIGQLSRENNDKTNKVLMLMVNDLRKYFILDRMISNDGIVSLAPMIIATYPSLTLEEIAVCFCNAKKGFYGEDFQRMDGATIMKWLRLFVEDKQQRLADKAYSKEVQYKAGQNEGRTERGESMEIFLKKATGAALVVEAQKK